MKRISRKSSKHKGLLKRVQRQMLKEQRSGLFENEEVRNGYGTIINNTAGLYKLPKIPTKIQTVC